MEGDNPNILQIPVEIKLDARGVEKHHEFNHLRSWTKVICRIEAVKAFPCFMKLSLFMVNDNNETTLNETNLIIRISIPGLSVQLASSRTKQFSYGLFWKANRKRCCAFLAFQKGLDFDQHMKWVKYWIHCLEYYRKDVLLNRRANMNSTMISENGQDVSMFSQVNSTQTVKDIKDILGPLPQIPIDLDREWVRRQSNISAIYEEIRDPRNISRASIVSGIYEEMQDDVVNELPISKENSIELPCDSAPPLPPRKKKMSGQNSLIKRSYTNSEADMIKKKKPWTLQNIVFEFTKRFDTPRKLQKPNLQKSNSSVRKRNFKTTLEKSKRSSFSTPDLTHLIDAHINYHRGSDAEQEFNFLHLNNPDHLNMSADFLNISFECISSDSNSLSEFDAEILKIDKSTNPYFNMKSHKETDQSEEHIYQVPKNIPIRLIDETTGYCIMSAVSAVNVNDEKCIKRHSSIKSLTLENKLDESNHYLQMDQVKAEINEIEKLDPVYVNITHKKIDLKKDSPKQNINNFRSPRYSIDDKIPSYFMNEDFYQKPRKHIHNSVPNTNTSSAEKNIYTLSPARHKAIRQLERCNMNISYENAMRNQIVIESMNQSKDDHDIPLAKSLDSKPDHKHPISRFGSIPRMKKIDFSPIRMKLSNVFHRYNNDLEQSKETLETPAC